MKKMRLIGTIIGVAGAIGAVAAIVYKKIQRKTGNGEYAAGENFTFRQYF